MPKKVIRNIQSWIAIEENFEILKSPQFVNEIYAGTPIMDEVLGHLTLMRILSIAEYVVKRNIEKDNIVIIDLCKV